MAAQIVSEVRSLIVIIPAMARQIYEAFLRLFTKPRFVMTGTITFEYVYDGSEGLNALGIFAVCMVGVGMVIGIVHFARKLFGRSR